MFSFFKHNFYYKFLISYQKILVYLGFKTINKHNMNTYRVEYRIEDPQDLNGIRFVAQSQLYRCNSQNDAINWFDNNIRLKLLKWSLKGDIYLYDNSTNNLISSFSI